jgi:hypothetical protein
VTGVQTCALPISTTISSLGMQTNIEYNLHGCHTIPTLPQRDLRLKYLNNSLRATQSCDFVIQKQLGLC